VASASSALPAQTYFEFDATAERFQRILDEMGISAALREAGIVEGDTVVIGDEVLEWTEG
jgi:GTPase